jgi:hypothetical protein
MNPQAVTVAAALIGFLGDAIVLFVSDALVGSLGLSAVAGCDPKVMQMALSFGIDSLDPNSTANNLIRTLVPGLGNDGTTAGYWQGLDGHFYWANPGWSP